MPSEKPPLPEDDEANYVIEFPRIAEEAVPPRPFHIAHPEKADPGKAFDPRHEDRYEDNKELANRLFKEASRDKHVRGIIAHLIIGSLNNRNILTEYDTVQFLEAYREDGPLVLAAAALPLLRALQKEHGNKKMEQYQGALQILIEHIYKDKPNSWSEVRGLLAEAFSKKEQAPQEETYAIQRLSREEQEEARKRIQIHGHPFGGQSLTVDDIAQEGLLPEYRMHSAGMTVWFSSNAYQLSERRYAVVGYVEDGEELIARSYYLSGSQGVWRYLPAYLPSFWEEGKIGHYDKGWGEESITLPIALQRALSEITGQHPPKKIQNPNFVFAGTARNKVVQIQTNEQGSYVAQVESVARKLEGDFYPEDKREKHPPESLALANEQQGPDFKKLLASWRQQSPIYGEITIEVFPSNSGELKYMFCTDPLGRSWIGGIEDSSPIRSTGLRRSWVDGGNLACPAYEYLIGGVDQTGGYGNEAMREGSYVDMYKNYLSRIPVIQEYQRQRKAR